MRWVGNATPPPRQIPGTHCLRGWVGPRAGLEGCGTSSSGIRSLDLPAHSHSLYRLSFRGQRTVQEIFIFLHTEQTDCGIQPSCNARCTGGKVHRGHCALGAKYTGGIVSIGQIDRYKFKIAWTYAFAPPFAFVA